MGSSSAESASSRDTAFLKDAEGFFNFRPSDFVERTPIGKGKCVPSLALAESRDMHQPPLWKAGALHQPRKRLWALFKALGRFVGTTPLDLRWFAV